MFRKFTLHYPYIYIYIYLYTHIYISRLQPGWTCSKYGRVAGCNVRNNIHCRLPTMNALYGRVILHGCVRMNRFCYLFQVRPSMAVTMRQLTISYSADFVLPKNYYFTCLQYVLPHTNTDVWCCQRNAPAALTPSHIVQEPGWTPEPVSMLCKTEMPLLAGNQTQILWSPSTQLGYYIYWATAKQNTRASDWSGTGWTAVAQAKSGAWTEGNKSLRFQPDEAGRQVKPKRRYLSARRNTALTSL